VIQERENSQRTGRKNPEEKKSGMTKNQPACRSQEPDKQPAAGSPEPLKEHRDFISCPGIWATPGYQNAHQESEHVAPSLGDEETSAGGAEASNGPLHTNGPEAVIAKEGPAPHRLSTFSCPGIWATPGHQNAQPDEQVPRMADSYGCPNTWATLELHNFHGVPTRVAYARPEGQAYPYATEVEPCMLQPGITARAGHEGQEYMIDHNQLIACPGIWATPGYQNAQIRTPKTILVEHSGESPILLRAAEPKRGYHQCRAQLPCDRHNHTIARGGPIRRLAIWEMFNQQCRSCNSQDPDMTQEPENSQRTGSQHPEEKKSGMTHNQPAGRTQEPDRQPAVGSQEPNTDHPDPLSCPGIWATPGYQNAHCETWQGASNSQDVEVSAKGVEAWDRSQHLWQFIVDTRGRMDFMPGEGSQVPFPAHHASPSCLGIAATPGCQDAHMWSGHAAQGPHDGEDAARGVEVYEKTPGTQGIPDSTAQVRPVQQCSKNLSCPGIWATPGYQNAQSEESASRQEVMQVKVGHTKVAHEVDQPTDFDVVAFMAAGVHLRPTKVGETPAPHLVDDPAIAAQENMFDGDEDPGSSDDDSSTSEDNPTWRNFYVYTVHQPPVQVSLLMIRPRVQHHQCARALGWTVAQLAAKYVVTPCPEDLLQSRLRGMLARYQDDPSEEGPLAMVLIDVEFHPPAPRWDPEIIRTAMFVPRDLTNHQFLESMHLLPYCRYNRRPCLLLLRGLMIQLDFEMTMQITDGSYLRVILPPPNQEDEATSTRCIAMACYQGIGQDSFAFFGELVEEYNLWSMPNPSQVLVVDSPEDAPDDEQVSLIQSVRLPQAMRTPANADNQVFSAQPNQESKPCSSRSIGPCPQSQNADGDVPESGIQATPEYHNACWFLRYWSIAKTVEGLSGQSIDTCFLPTGLHSSPPNEGSKSFLCMHRLGEASKPGPQQANEGWAIAAINPTGLSGKAKQFSDMPAGIYAISETHLSARGQARFREELFHAKSSLKLYPGYRAPLKKDSIQAVGGKHTGVAFLTHFPTRPVTSGWNEELYQTSRIHAAVFMVQNTWIAGGVCYGYAKDADSPAVQENTNRLLQEVARQVMHGFKGPAFIAGDFNQVPGVLSETTKWEQKGWRDVQTWAAERYGISPGVTCQFTSRKDFVYLSPELQAMLSGCTNSFDRWPDHSTLMGNFTYPSQPEPQPRWDRPASIDYSIIDSKTIASTPCSPAPIKGDPTEQYKAICRKFEQHVQDCLKAKGKVGLQPNQKGRGHTLKRTFRHSVVAPVKPARQGDYQPSVHTWSLLHSRWITQCRRLQSYAKHIGKGSITPNAIEHRAALWRAIRKALGFSGGFPKWWAEQASDHPNLLPWIPVDPPNPAIAKHISDHFLAVLSAMESRIIQQRVAQARQNRIEDTNRVFKDVRRPMPVPVSMLVAKASTQVTEVVDEGSVEVADSTPIQDAAVLETRTGPMQVIHIEANQIWFTSPHTLVPGDEVAIVELQGKVQEVHSAFLQEWTKRWDRHKHLDPTHWDEVIALTQSILHAEQMELAPLTLAKWKHALKSKKATAATGLDGLARKDLLSFPDVLHEQLPEVFRHAERTGQWPQQLLQGAVHALEKTANAEKVSQYRPITIMPCAYRIYSSIRAREVLQHLAKVLPPTLLGNIPGKQAIGLWWTLQHRIEQAMYAGEPLTGAVSDLCKAFNHLPRLVTFQAAASLGVHPDIIRAWSASTVHLQRHFVVRDCPSAQVTSTTGFVEGCGMSVVGMVLINALVHAYMQHQHPQTVFTTYVDNYELQAPTVEQTTKALSSLQGFCDLLDVQLDVNKTYHWACDAAGRAHLRAQNDLPVRSAKDLGAHMQYTANQTNGTVLAKFRQLPELWHKLARSHAPQSQKLKVLRVVAWPRTLYSGSIVHIGPAHFDEARAGAFKAIGMQKSGANAQIFLSLVATVSSDPEFYALWNTVTQFRRHIMEDLLDITLQQAAITPPRRRKPGPGGVLVTRLEQICWSYVQNGIFRDGEGGSIHILHTPRQELKARLSRAWQHAVGRRWEHRKGFQGLRYVCPMISQIDRTQHAPDAVGFLQVAQTGAFYTADCLKHSGFTDSSACTRCSAEDSVEHRHWQCPATAPSRALIPPSVQARIDTMEPCLRQHGWMPEPKEVRDYKLSLAEVPDTMCNYAHAGAQSHFDLFCDGTGLDPKRPQTRLVAWAVVLAGVDPQTPHAPLAWGGVPGQWQTVMRAELTAFVSALCFGVSTGTTFAIWSDCEVIVKRARRIQQGTFEVTSICTDHDLWMIVQDRLPDSSVCSLHHIRSHQDYVGDESWVQWACSANDTADLLATWALENLPPNVRHHQQKASEAVANAKEVVQHVHSHMVRVAQLAVTTAAPSPAPVYRLPDTMILEWRAIAEKAVDAAPANLRFPKWLTILDWMREIDDQTAAPRWLSWYELLVSYQLYAGEWGPESTSSHNTWRMNPRLQEYCGKQALRSWAAYLLNLIKLQYPHHKPIDGRPSNPRFHCWTMGILCRISDTHADSIRNWLDSTLGDVRITKMTILHQTGPAEAVRPPPKASQSEHGLHRFWQSQR